MAHGDPIWPHSGSGDGGGGRGGGGSGGGRGGVDAGGAGERVGAAAVTTATCIHHGKRCVFTMVTIGNPIYDILATLWPPKTFKKPLF